MEEPKVFSDEAIAKLRQDCTRLGVAARQISAAFAAAYVPASRRIVEAFRPLVEFANSPEGQALIRAEEMRRSGRAAIEGCHCLCVKRHPDRNLCLGEVLGDEMETVRFRSDLLGAVDVPMCRPCANSGNSEIAP